MPALSVNWCLIVVSAVQLQLRGTFLQVRASVFDHFSVKVKIKKKTLCVKLRVQVNLWCDRLQPDLQSELNWSTIQP